MSLCARFRPCVGNNLPVLVWLHGFLGDRDEWREVAASLPTFTHLFIDLPGHGGSAPEAVNDFTDMSALLADTLDSYNILNYWLVGYSLGGRIAMNFACQQKRAGLQGLIVEGGHPGLTQQHMREERLAADRRWAQRLREEPIAAVLTDWYRQPVFASLSEAQRTELVTLRSRNNPHALAAMLEATSLGLQADLRQPLGQLGLPFHYLYGERDAKFCALADELSALSHSIAAAGHNAHRENARAVARCIATILRQHAEDQS